MKQRARTRGQAIVEFALAATLIFFLLAAAVDLGLIFFAVQGLTNAAQEGATYGSRWLISDPTTKARKLDVARIQQHVRLESGASGGSGFTNLLDLNADGVDDASQGSSVIDPSGQAGYILVRAVQDTNGDGDPTNDLVGGALTTCANPASATVFSSCYAQVIIKQVHKLIFPLTPAFANDVTLTSSYYVLIRDSYEESPPSVAPIFQTSTPTPSPSNVVVTITSPTNGATLTSRTQTAFEATAWDTAKGTTNGAGIASVTIKVYNPNGTLYRSVTDTSAKYCAFGGSCSGLSQNEWNALPAGTYIVQAQAVGTSGATSSLVQVSFKK